MFKSIALCFFTLVAVLVGTARADSWDPPSTSVVTSANGEYRATIVPAIVASDHIVPGARKQPYARVERRVGGQWQLVWDQSLVNKVKPSQVLITDDGSYLVTFDNWAGVGRGDDVVVIYDRRGTALHKFSLRQILPPRYVRFVPKTTSSTWWRNDIRLIEGDTQVEVDVVEPGPETHVAKGVVPVRIRLADAAVLSGGPAWERAMAKIDELDALRQAEWDALRLARMTPRPAPTTDDSREWKEFASELGSRLVGQGFDTWVYREDASRPAQQAASDVTGAVGRWKNEKWSYKHHILVSPVSERFAPLLAAALKARVPGSLRGLHLVFVGTPAEGRVVELAAAHTGLRVTLLDRSQPIPPGTMPATPPEDFLLGGGPNYDE